MSTSPKNKTIDELAVEAVQLGRKIAEAARAVHLGGNTKDAVFVTRSLARLRDRQPLHEADEGGFETIRELLEADLTREIVDYETQFSITDFDECGPLGVSRQVPIYSERGDKLSEIKQQFSQFCEIRSELFDHLAAHRLLIEKMDIR